MKPHKWQKEIIAWANGAEIECRTVYKHAFGSDKWSLLIDSNPHWDIDNIEFRIKPQPKEPHEVSEQYGKAVQQAYEDGFVQGKIYAETGQVSDGATIPKEPQYLYVYKTMTNAGLQIQLWDSKTYNNETYIGKIKLETDDD